MSKKEKQALGEAMPTVDEKSTVYVREIGSEDKIFRNKSVEIRTISEHVGRGLFAAEDIKIGERVFSFNGSFVSSEKATPMALQVGEKLFLETDGNFDYENCVNHACYTGMPTSGPSCRIEFHFDRPIDRSLIGQRSKPGEVVLVADREIKKGDQLLFDYATTEVDMYDEDEKKSCSFVCTCGAGCRGPVRGFENLTDEQAKLLYPLMSPYIQSLARKKFGAGVRGNNFPS